MSFNSKTINNKLNHQTVATKQKKVKKKKKLTIAQTITIFELFRIIILWKIVPSVQIKRCADVQDMQFYQTCNWHIYIN